jgi:hypothetical protein
VGDLGFLLSGCSPAEHAARLRELRALALVYFGLRHPVTAALGEAIGDLSMVDRALADSVRSRLCDGAGCCAYGALMTKQQTAVRC